MSSDAPDRHPVCLRCGTDAGGAAWCPNCGLNLRVRDESSAEGAPPPAPILPPPGPGFSRSRMVLAGAAVVLLVSGSATAIILLTRGGGSSDRATPVLDSDLGGFQTSADEVATTVPEEPQVTRDNMHEVLVNYVTAFDNEDVYALEDLFATDLTRTNGTEPSQTLGEALDTYSEQFSNLSNPEYVLNELQYTEGVYAGSATGVYTISTSNAPDSSGSINFSFVSVDGRLLIDGIRITPY